VLACLDKHLLFILSPRNNKWSCKKRLNTQPFYAIVDVDALAMVKVAKLGDAAAAEANHVRAGRIQRWAAFLSKSNAIVVCAT
jgi:hypothetical protein